MKKIIKWTKEMWNDGDSKGARIASRLSLVSIFLMGLLTVISLIAQEWVVAVWTGIIFFYMVQISKHHLLTKDILNDWKYSIDSKRPLLEALTKALHLLEEKKALEILDGIEQWNKDNPHPKQKEYERYASKVRQEAELHEEASTNSKKQEA